MTENPQTYALPVYDEGIEAGLIEPELLTPHPENPREKVAPDDPSIVLLANDLRERGIIEPLVVTRAEGFILAGNRRHAAALVAGLKKVPVVYRELRPGEFAQDIFLSENGHRENLSPLEMARAMASLADKIGCSRKDVARRLNMSSSVVTQTVCILDCTERVQQLFHKSELPVTAARQLKKLKEHPDEQERIANLVYSRKLSTTSLAQVVDRRVAELASGEDDAPKKAFHKNGSVLPQGLTLGAGRPDFSREAMIDSLRSKGAMRIPLSMVAKIAEAECCTCGMMNNKDLCQQCPMARLLSAISGRASED